MDAKHGHKAIVFCPIYTFHYNGVKYSVSNDEYSNIGIPKLGETVTIFIDPDDPDTFYRRSVTQDVFCYFIGGMLILIPLAVWLVQ